MSLLEDTSIKSFYNLNGLKSLINVPRLFKNLNKPKCIDLVLTNKPIVFHHSTVLETGICDLHLLTVTEFKISFQKQKPKVTHNSKFISDVIKQSFDKTILVATKTPFSNFLTSMFH